MTDEQIRHCKDIITFLIKYENNLNGEWRNWGMGIVSSFFNWV